MGAEKKICCSIMICQMTAILSGVAMIYLSVIVVMPSIYELNYEFDTNPIMCTTVLAEDLAAGGKKVECPWSTCGEWCLSKTSSPCMQIHVMPRREGAPVTMGECEHITWDTCSDLNVTLTNERLCKKGECKDMTGLFNCSKGDLNSCRDISIGYNCTDKSLKAINKTVVKCDEKKCASRLDGVYLCVKGECNKIEDKESYKDCKRKCDNLDLTKGNTVIFSKNRLISAKCSYTDSNSSNSIPNLNDNQNWKTGNKYMFIFCSYIKEEENENGKTSFDLTDCFNASLRDRNEVNQMKSFLKLNKLHLSPPRSLADWLTETEEELRIMNDTRLLINSEGCVNTLSKECKAFFSTHATDGRDGQTPDRFPCYHTNSTSEFVIGKFNPDKTFMYLMIASILPVSLFVLSCSCLFFCSKSVSVDEGGQLKVTLLKKKDSSRKASEL